MSYTTHVRALGRRRPAFEDPDADPRPTLDRMERDLAVRVRWRGLWEASPERLGVVAASWGAEAIQELALGCYPDVILVPLPRLLDRLRVWDTVDPLVVRLVRQFVTHRQRRHDAVGFGLWTNVRSVARDVLLSGDATLRPAGGVMRATSIVAFAEGDVADRSRVRAALAGPAWADIGARAGRRSAQGRAAVACIFGSLRDACLPSFVLGDLVAVLRLADAEAITGMPEEEYAFEEVGGQLLPVLLAQPMLSNDDADAVDRITVRVQAAIAVKPAAKAAQLRVLWSILVEGALREEAHSLAELADLLDRKKSSVFEDLQTLRKLLRTAMSDDFDSRSLGEEA